MTDAYAGVLLVHTTPNAGVTDEEFNTWYDTVHIPEILDRIPGVDSADRYRVDGGETSRYLTIYQISADPKSILAAMRTVGLSDAAPFVDLGEHPPTISSAATHAELPA